MIFPTALRPRAVRLRDLRAELAYDSQGRIFIRRADPSAAEADVPSTTSLIPASIPEKEASTPLTTTSSSSTSSATPQPPVGPPGGPGGPPNGPPPNQDSQGFFTPPPPSGPPPGFAPSPSSGQACLLPGSTLTYTDANGTVHNYTNIGGTCVGLDVGESSNVNNTSPGDLHDPFFASITPQTFALAGATIASAILFILLFLSRTRKPWLQKIAAFSMMVSLITYMVAAVNLLQQQYVQGRYDADDLRDVNQDLPVMIIAYIASFFIYFAQVQTLMRIFPRKRDKVIIKWTGFSLIILTMLFCALYQFLQPAAPPPPQRNMALQIFLQILPPLNYLFSIALAFIYMCCVVYFGIAHRRVAFTVPAGIILALLSLGCITIPIIFFCLDIWAQFVAGWGEYIRSIASIGSTIIVWEWIDRVEELESKRAGKDGILGRRIFEDEFEIGPVPKSPSTDSFAWMGWSKKIRVPSFFSGISGKTSEWSLKLQAKLDRRSSNPTPPSVTEVALANLDAAVSSVPGSTTLPSSTEDGRTTTSGDDTYTIYTGTSGTSHSPLVGGRRPRKKHQYAVARIGNTTRDLTRMPTTSQSPPIIESRQSPVASSPHLNLSSSPLQDNLGDRPSSSDAPPFHIHESQDLSSGQRPFSVLPGFNPGDYFIDPGELEKRGHDSQA